MTKSDYEILAKVIGKHLNTIPTPFIEELLAALKKDNPKFDDTAFAFFSVYGRYPKHAHNGR
jgi:hypothetical protein